MVARSKLFMTHKSQAVRLPKDVAFPEDVLEVEIIKAGNSRIVTPVGKRWSDFFENGPFVSDDFLAERMELDFDERDPL
jgi:antitoxin VapB